MADTFFGFDSTGPVRFVKFTKTFLEFPANAPETHPIWWIIVRFARSNSTSSELFISERIYRVFVSERTFFFPTSYKWCFFISTPFRLYRIRNWFFPFVWFLADDFTESSSHTAIDSTLLLAFPILIHIYSVEYKVYRHPSRFDSRSISYCVKFIYSADCRMDFIHFYRKMDFFATKNLPFCVCAWDSFFYLFVCLFRCVHVVKCSFVSLANEFSVFFLVCRNERVRMTAVLSLA